MLDIGISVFAVRCPSFARFPRRSQLSGPHQVAGVQRLAFPAVALGDGADEDAPAGFGLAETLHVNTLLQRGEMAYLGTINRFSGFPVARGQVGFRENR